MELSPVVALPCRRGEVGGLPRVDIPFVFDRMDLAAFVGEKPPLDLSREIHGAWERFARTGDPNGGTLPSWPHHDPATRPTMDFDTSIRVIENPDDEVSGTWEGAWAVQT